jgi:hypothetical protein
VGCTGKFASRVCYVWPRFPSLPLPVRPCQLIWRMLGTCGIIRSSRNCAYLVLPRERHVDVLSLNFPLTELFTLNYVAQLRGNNRSFCCTEWDPPTLRQVAGPSGLNVDCSGSTEERDWSPCLCVYEQRHIRKSWRHLHVTLHRRSIVLKRCQASFLSLMCRLFDFFFYWRYNPLWVLAFSVILFHSVLSLHNFLHPIIPILCISAFRLFSLNSSCEKSVETFNWLWKWITSNVWDFLRGEIKDYCLQCCRVKWCKVYGRFGRTIRLNTKRWSASNYLYIT